MSKSRKTISVTDLVDRANAFLKLADNPGYVDPQFREGVAQLLEYVLFETNNYRGFQYQESPSTWEGLNPKDRTRKVYYHPKGA